VTDGQIPDPAEQMSDYAAAHGWNAVEEFLPEDDWMFGMPTWKLTVHKDGELFAESVRFGMGKHRYSELLEAMTEWDGLSEDERAARRAEAAQEDTDAESAQEDDQ
jgi:hypothetical protein